MARFVQIETVNVGPIWVNPDLVTTIHIMDGITVLTRADGASLHAKGSVEQIIEQLK